jgi:8-oxo-dGTP pyrophosphatase MutT (NUDIX family)
MEKNFEERNNLLEMDLSTSPNVYRENIKIRDTRNIYCGNCGKAGHTYRKCKFPITSCGVILYKNNKFFEEKKNETGDIINNHERYFFLLIRRKDTLGYVEFLRGKYEEKNEEYLIKIFQTMTKGEVERIRTLEFSQLWNELWSHRNYKQYQTEFENSKSKFLNLKNNVYMNMENIIEKANTEFEEKEWGFPKGRRNIKETDYDCANREFQEETGFESSEYTILKNIKPVEEIFYGSNDIRYKHIYYIGECLCEKKLKVDPDNKFQATEIGGIEWFNLNDAVSKIRPYNREKKDVLRKVHKLLVTNNC